MGQEQFNTAVFVVAFNNIQKIVHQTALEKGWWDVDKDVEKAATLMEEWILPECAEYLREEVTQIINNLRKKAVRGPAECIALMHSELSEALEGLRHGNPPDDKIPEFNAQESEYADVIIRIMDEGEKRGLRIAEAMIAKIAFNTTRPPKHGKQF